MFYVLDEHHNLIEAYDKEGVLAVLSQAIKDGSLSGITADSAFVSKVKCCVTGGTNKVAFVTQAKYNELLASGSLLANCMYYITDDTTADDIDAELNSLTGRIQRCESNVDGIIDGSVQTCLGLGAGTTASLSSGMADRVFNLDAGGVYLIILETKPEVSIVPKEVYTSILTVKDGNTFCYSTEMSHGRNIAYNYYAGNFMAGVLTVWEDGLPDNDFKGTVTVCKIGKVH
jgi:hypothetical protein